MPTRAAATASTIAGSAAAAEPRSTSVGQGARWIEPVAPPGPDLLGDVGQERRQQPELDLEGDREGGPGRVAGPGRRPRVVGALLDQLEVVVAELPEELLGDLERGRVVVGLERLGRPGDDHRQAAEQRAVDRLGDLEGVEGRGLDAAEDELRGVEHLHRQPPADLHLRLVERRVQAGPRDGGAPADGVRAVRREQVLGVDPAVAAGLRELVLLALAGAGEHEARDQDVAPGQRRRSRSWPGRRVRTARCG